ncbi:threonine--tRNA ligase [Brockia lithotrophica]|uniref:Threonine--tRNA ligase n=1 Tax=Brockia lithotrophica TaxID=933949 RepID=A0A660KUA9_9BACL|nr:threonine--tRNA ligase [Brockia lithotrophica]RKQ84628.1 threonyl-tRNA synthetase [Brockia lithotrophica]
MAFVLLPDGRSLDVPEGATAMDVAKLISPSLAKKAVAPLAKRPFAALAKKAVAAEVDGRLVDLTAPVPSGAKVRIVTWDDPEGLEVLRHTTAHVLAQALLRLYPGTKLAVGAATEDGFFYDVEPPTPLSAEDLPRIEEEMRRIVAEDLPIRRREVSREEAEAIFRERGETYKLELLRDIPEGETISVYEQGEFVDLCRGPHLPSTGRLKAFKLLSVSGAYFRGDPKNPMLTRIAGTAFPTEEELKRHLKRLEEMRERDHRKLGRELKYFTFSPEVGQGLPLWLPNGATVRRIVERYIVDKELERGYLHVYTPVLANTELYKISGHWDHYHENMYPPMVIDHEELVLRPMNCPHHMMIYKSETRSYRDLPLRIAELGMMFRYEASGALTGLHRVRGMTLNDAHIFVTPEQIEEEIRGVIELILEVYRDFGIKDYWFRLSLRDPADKESFVDNDAMWEIAEAHLRRALDSLGIPYREAVGEAAFYGPKLDVQVQTATGKDETLSTVQVDFYLPERFALEYVGPDGAPHRPVVIHRGVVGTMERFVAFLLEYTKGAMPLWLAPIQVAVLTLTDAEIPYAREVDDRLRRAGFRTKLDVRNEKLGYKIREAEVEKIPYILVVGKKEAETGTVAVRRRGRVDEGVHALDAFLERLKAEVAARGGSELAPES